MDKLENIDLVYPKTMPSKSFIIQRIEQFIITSLDTISTLTNEDDGDNIGG